MSVGLDGVVVTGAGTESDADLAAAVGTGDERASGELYRRHHTAVLGYARGLVRDQHTAEDLTSEAFVRTFAALRQGKGPQEGCRPYLYTVVRNAAVDWARAGRRTVVTDEVAAWADASTEDPPDVDELDAAVRAFRSLPERWQTVLWHTVVEDEPAQAVAELLGMTSGAVAQLSFRAREGLRQAFLVASCEGHPDCAEFTAQLAASLRRPGRRRSRALREHLDSCERCRLAAQEMADLNGRLRRCLPVGAVVLGAPTVSLDALSPGAASAPGWAVHAGVAGTAAVVVVVLFMTFGGGGGTAGSPDAGAPPASAAVPSAPASTPAPSASKRQESARSDGERPAGPKGIKPAKKRKGGAAAASGGYRVRNTTLFSCLAPVGASVRQRSCTDPATAWKRKNAGGGFTLTSASNGKCLARGKPSASVPWEGSTEYAVTTAPCGGAHQVWNLVRFAPAVYRLSNGAGWYLQASYSGLQPVTLKSSSFSGMAAQGWAVEPSKN